MHYEWNNIGHGLDALLRDNHTVWLRCSRHQTNHPTMILETDSQGHINNLYTTDGTHAGSIDSRIWIIGLVQNHLLELQKVQTVSS